MLPNEFTLAKPDERISLFVRCKCTFSGQVRANERAASYIGQKKENHVPVRRRYSKLR